MDLEQMKKLITKRVQEHEKKVALAKVSRAYFNNEGDILKEKNPNDKGDGKGESTGLRHSDNRIPHNYHQLITEQSVSYGFTIPPQFDVSDDENNKLVRDKFNGQGYFAEVCTELALETTHFTVAWIHYWLDKDLEDKFDYGVVPGDQIIPIYTGGLKKNIKGVLRYYLDEDENGNDIIVYEYWDKEKAYCFFNRGTVLGNVDSLGIYPIGNSGGEPTSVITHDFPGRVPFIPFFNGFNNKPNLFRYKSSVDAYDSVFSGFINDVEDLQEIILILTNYGGSDLRQFKEELKEYKAIKIDQMDDQDKSGVGQLAIEIPVDARNSILEQLKVHIWDSGQGFRPTTETITATSGVALDQMYSSLELKVKLMETKFRVGFTELIRVYLDHTTEGEYNELVVKQDWRRNRVKSMIESANVVAVLANTTSKENLAKYNPIVSDWQAELEMKDKDEKEAMEQQLEMQSHVMNQGFSSNAGNFLNGKKGNQSEGTLEEGNPANNTKKIRKKVTGKGVGNE